MYTSTMKHVCISKFNYACNDYMYRFILLKTLLKVFQNLTYVYITNMQTID